MDYQEGKIAESQTSEARRRSAPSCGEERNEENGIVKELSGEDERKKKRKLVDQGILIKEED